jgi:DNA-binding transcriptional regulator/RsmH inhibitor MraZ
MFCGRWNLRVDKKWRLNIPTAINGIGNFILLCENDDGCIRIENLPLGAAEVADPASVFIIEAGKRILIPQSLRGSTSFYYGRRVTLAGKGDHLELWPRP